MWLIFVNVLAMGKKTELKKQEAELNKSWHKKHAPLLITAGAVALGWVGLVKRQESIASQEHEKQVSVERKKYGNLYDYRDQISHAMIAPEENGRRDYEDFLPKLARDNNKFEVKVYLGAPPTGTKLPLHELPENLKKSAMKGLQKWNSYFTFRETKNIAEADVKIFSESEALALMNQNGRALMPNQWMNHELWRQYAQDANILGHVIILNHNYIGKALSNPNFPQFVVAHEFGHFISLQHPDTEFYFGIKNVNGITDPTKVNGSIIGKILTEQALLHPTFPKLSIMLADGSLDVGERELGDLDQRAIKILFDLYKQKYPHSDKLQNETKSSNDSRGR